MLRCFLFHEGIPHMSTYFPWQSGTAITFSLPPAGRDFFTGKSLHTSKPARTTLRFSETFPLAYRALQKGKAYFGAPNYRSRRRKAWGQ